TVGQEHDRRRRAAAPARAAALDRLQRGGQALAGRRALAGAQVLERALDLVVVAAGRREQPRGLVERDEPEPHLIGHLPRELLGGVAGGGQARGLDVGGLHRG